MISKFWAYFTAHAQKRLFIGGSGQKYEPAVRSGDLDFLQNRCISTTEWRLRECIPRDIFDVFVLLRRV